MKRLILALSLLTLPLFATTPTTVTQTLYGPNFQPIHGGTITISYPFFCTEPDGHVITAINLSVPISQQGLFSIALAPTDVCVPAGTYYTVKYSLPNGITRPNEFWTVPSSGSPVGLSSVVTFPAPVPAAIIALSYLAQGGATTGQALVWNGTSWAPGTVSLPNIVSPSTQTKITYNAQGLVTAGAQANFTDLAGSIAVGQTPLSTNNSLFIRNNAGALAQLTAATIGNTNCVGVTAGQFVGLPCSTGTFPGTLVIASGKTFTINNTLTLAGTDGITITTPTTSFTAARTDAANIFTGHQTIEGVASTGATGSGKFVFDTSPTFPNGISIGTGPASGTWVAGSGGTSGGKAVKQDTSDPGKVIVLSTSDTQSLGLAQSSVSAAANVEITYEGTGTCISDNTVTAGHILIPGTATAGAYKDSGQTIDANIPSTTPILGRAIAGAGGAGFTFTCYITPLRYGTQSSTGALTSAHLFIGNVSNVATDTAIFGDSTVTNAGLWTNQKVNGVAFDTMVNTFSATPVYNLLTGSTQTITLTGNVTSSSFTGGVKGLRYTFIICQDGTGSRTYAWGAAWKSPMTIGSTASLCSVQTFVALNATTLYATGVGVLNQ